MRQWLDIIKENSEKVDEAIRDGLPDRPTKKTFTIEIDGAGKVSSEDFEMIADLVGMLKEKMPDIEIKIIEVSVPKDSTYEGAIVETIRKVSGGYRLVSKSGKNLGTYPTKAGAEKREKQVQYFKHVDEGSSIGKVEYIIVSEKNPTKQVVNKTFSTRVAAENVLLKLDRDARLGYKVIEKNMLVSEDTDNLVEIAWLDENLHKWFKEKWVRFGPDGKIRGECARGSAGEGKPKCLPQKKAHALGKKGRASAAARKRREDPNPDRSGPAKNVATKKKTNEGVAEGKELDQKQVRAILNDWMNKDQKYKDPTSRVSFQTQIWPYIQKNIEIILNDKGDKGNGDYPAAPYAAWLLVQHMDAFPQNQINFYKRLKEAIPNHPKIQFLRDRAAVNQWIMKHANDPKYYYKDKPLPNPTVNVRNPKIFKDAGIIATSREESLQNAKEAGNKLLVDAVLATNALTQPSFKQGVAEEQLDELKCWTGYTRVKGTKAGAPGSCKKTTNEDEQEIKAQQGVAEGKVIHTYLWHGSRQKIPMLEPRQAVDTGGAVGSNQNAIYATSDPIFAIQMGMPAAGSDYGHFPNDSQMVLFSGKIRKGEYVYLHKLPFNGPDGKPQFVKGGNSREFHSIPGVQGIKPIEIKEIPVNRYLSLIRKATPADLKLRKKYMKKQGVAEAVLPNSELQSSILYHGTPTQAGYKGISSQGLKVNPEVIAQKYKGQEDFAPLPGGVYMTKEFGNAVRYSFMSEVPDEQYSDYIKQEPYGYVFEFSGKNLTSLTPDEDELGSFIEKLVKTKNLPPNLSRIVQSIPQQLRVKLQQPHIDFPTTAVAGKWVVNNISDATMQYLLKKYHNVVNYGSIKPVAVWVIPKPNERFLRDRQGTFNTYNGYVNYAKKFGKRYDLSKEEQGVAESLDEAVGGNYLYHATGANGLSSILQSGYIKSAAGPQKATQAQTALPTVSVTRDWGYASGSNAQSQDGGIGRDAILILDRNALESNYKTISTSQSRDIRGMPRASEPGLSGALTVRKAVVKPGVELKGQHKMSYGTAKAGGEFEEAVVVPKGVLPLKGTMVGFWVNPNSELMKDPTIMNDPRRLDMLRPNQFVKATQQQGVAEGIPQSGDSSGKAKQFNPNAKIQTREMTLDQILSSVKGIPYVNDVIQDWDAKDYSWSVTKKVIEYAQYLQKNPQSVANLPPLVVIDGQLNDGAHRLSAINLLQKRMDSENPLWKQVKLKVNFGTSADVMSEQGVSEKQLDEKWSAKYKRSINCNNPRGFSQRAHCAGRKKKVNESDKKLSIQLYCPHCDGLLVEESQINEKKDACYYKVKSRYKVWPSAYASGALVKCRKKGAANWGKSKK